MTRRVLLLPLLLWPLVTGCVMLDVTPAREDVVPYQTARKAAAPFRRVLLAPLRREDGADAAELKIRRALADAVVKQRVFEIVPVSRRELVDIEVERSRTMGTFSTEDLLALNRRFGVDGVLTGTLTRFEAYPEMTVGLRLHLIDCRTGRVAWGTDNLLSASDPRVRRDAHNFYDLGYHDPADSLDEENKVLISPRVFSRYVAHRVVETLAVTLQPPPKPVPGTDSPDPTTARAD